MKHWLTAALVCFGSTAHALSVKTVASASGSESNTYTSSKTFTDTVLFSGAILQTGSGGIKASSFTATYGISASTIAISGSTFTVTTAGIASAPSNPFALNRVPSQNLTSGAYTKMFLDNDAGDASDPQGGQWGGSASSGTYTAKATGRYALLFSSLVNPAGASTWIIRFKKNGSTDHRQCNRLLAAGTQTVECLRWITLTAGDTIEVFVYHDSSSTSIGGGGSVTDTFTMKKDDM